MSASAASRVVWALSRQTRPQLANDLESFVHAGIMAQMHSSPERGGRPAGSGPRASSVDLVPVCATNSTVGAPIAPVAVALDPLAVL
jgi:hypothetical protein